MNKIITKNLSNIKTLCAEHNIKESIDAIKNYIKNETEIQKMLESI